MTAIRTALERSLFPELWELLTFLIDGNNGKSATPIAGRIAQVSSDAMMVALRSVNAIGAGGPMASKSAATTARVRVAFALACCDREAMSFFQTASALTQNMKSQLRKGPVWHLADPLCPSGANRQD